MNLAYLKKKIMEQKAQETASVFCIKPRDFMPAMHVAACYVESNGKLLLLQRSPNKSEGTKWGVPAGKVEQGETIRQAVFRETFEETGLLLDDGSLQFLGTLFVRKPHIDFAYHMFHQQFTSIPPITLNSEHMAYRSVSLENISDLPLVAGGVEAIYHFKALANKPKIARIPFYFIRHGETDVNADPAIKRVDYDLPLNKRGREQALAAQKIIGNIPPKSVCFSPIQRAVETKDILISNFEIEQVESEDLGECKAHVWTKMVQFEEGQGYNRHPEVEQFLDRTMQGLSRALEKNFPTLIVAHGGIHFALCYQLSIENHPWKIGNCQLVHFQPVGEFSWEAKIL